jgi:hypothetical protein
MEPTPPVATPAVVAQPGVLGSWGRPPDRPSQVTLALAVALLVVAAVPAGARWLGSLVDFSAAGDLRRRRRFLAVSGFVASFLSLGYVALYLRGGPRDPLAAVYWLQGRALSHLQLSFTVPDPVASFRGQFLLPALPDRLAGVLPPGYPLLLAAGFLVGAPMLVGPLLGAALVGVTWALAREVVLATGKDDLRAEAVARVAVGLSMISAAMRMATADVLPGGAIAVAIAGALAAALLARRLGEPRLFGLAGLAVGGVVATQPLAAVAVAAIVVSLAVGGGRRAFGWALVAALPGVLLLLAAHRAALGRAFGSPSAVYLSAIIPSAPVDPRGALLVALERVRNHLADVDNLEPLALLALVPLLVKPRARAAILLGLAVAGHLLVSAALSRDASSRTLAAVVPLEHVLLALGVATLARASAARDALPRAALATLALALAGFACHTAHDHARRAAADLGRPHYEPDVAREGNVTSGLLYFDDDQGFELAFDPAVPASHGVQAVRLRGDDHDRLLYDSLGHPQIHKYVVADTGASVVPWTPANAGSDTWRFEAESDWPPLAAAGARALVLDSSAPCASDGHSLQVAPPKVGEGIVTLALPVPRGPTPPEKRTWMVTPRVVQLGGSGSAVLTLVPAPGGPALATWKWEDAGKPGPPACIELPPHPVDLGGEVIRAWLELRASKGPVTLDKTTLRPR